MTSVITSASGQKPSTAKIVGGLLLLAGASPTASGIYHTVATGTCSSTGFDSSLGAVPYCPSGTGAYIGMLLVGILLMIVGAVMVMGGGMAPAPLFCAIGIGSLGVGVGPYALHNDQESFSILFGACFLGAGVIWLGIWVYAGLKALRFNTAMDQSRSARAQASTAKHQAKQQARAARTAATAVGASGTMLQPTWTPDQYDAVEQEAREAQEDSDQPPAPAPAPGPTYQTYQQPPADPTPPTTPTAGTD